MMASLSVYKKNAFPANISNLDLITLRNSAVHSAEQTRKFTCSGTEVVNHIPYIISQGLDATGESLRIRYKFSCGRVSLLGWPAIINVDILIAVVLETQLHHFVCHCFVQVLTVDSVALNQSMLSSSDHFYTRLDM